MVSPKAREKPRTEAARMPGAPFLRTTCRVVSHRVAPRDVEASRSDRGTEAKTSSVTWMIVGKVMTEDDAAGEDAVARGLDAGERGEDVPDEGDDQDDAPDAVNDRGQAGQKVDDRLGPLPDPAGGVFREVDRGQDRYGHGQGETRHRDPDRPGDERQEPELPPEGVPGRGEKEPR